MAFPCPFTPGLAKKDVILKENNIEIVLIFKGIVSVDGHQSMVNLELWV